MQGYPNFNYEAFDAAAKKLRDEGHIVFNPAEQDREDHGDEALSKLGDIKEAQAKGFSLRRALYLDTKFICLQADAVAMLPGWELSQGAVAEHRLASALKREGMKIIYLD